MFRVVSSNPREQILQAAVQLFYGQGYNQTGINQLIEASGVAKRTFYHHFASKEQLGLAYLDGGAEHWFRTLTQAAAGRRSATGVARGIFQFLLGFAEDTQFRGCSILNLAAEFADAEAPLRARVREHKLAQRALVRELFAKHGVSPATADQISVLIDGAIAMSAALLETTPIRAAADAAEQLLISTQLHPSSLG